MEGYLITLVLLLSSALIVLFVSVPILQRDAYRIIVSKSSCKHKLVSKKDVEGAMAWAKLRIALNSPETEYFKDVVDDLKRCKIRTTIYKPSGVHINLIRDFANAWRNS